MMDRTENILTPMIKIVGLTNTDQSLAVVFMWMYRTPSRPARAVTVESCGVRTASLMFARYAEVNEMKQVGQLLSYKGFGWQRYYDPFIEWFVWHQESWEKVTDDKEIADLEAAYKARYNWRCGDE